MKGDRADEIIAIKSMRKDMGFIPVLISTYGLSSVIKAAERDKEFNDMFITFLAEVMNKVSEEEQ